MSAQHPTVHDDHLISLIDGKPCVLLKAHLYKHRYRPQRYRAAFNLPEDYPKRLLRTEHAGLSCQRRLITATGGTRTPT